MSPDRSFFPIVGRLLADCGVDILYIGSTSELDRKLVEAAGIRFKSIFTGKLRRYFSWRNFIDPFFAAAGFFQSFFLVIRFWPDAVFCKGGFVSLPVAFAAYLFRRPIILHESDRIMGLANRIIARLATKICVAFPDVNIGNIQYTNSNSQKIHKLQIPTHKKDQNNKFVLTGNPVRLSILHGDAGKGYRLTGFHPQRPVLLVWGGSQGAMEINQMTEESYPHIKSIFQVVHVTGYGKHTGIHDPSYAQFEYLDEELKHIYAITDVVVGRAGANSLYELALMKKPNILIPLKSSAHNHQQLNAEYFESLGASIILRGQPLHEVLIALWHNPAELERMKEALGRIAKPDAACRIAHLLLEVSSKK